MARRLLLIGGGGHCSSVLDAVLKSGQYDEIGIVDYDIEASKLGVPVVGNDGELSRLASEGWTHAFISVGSVGDVRLRKKLYSMVKKLNFQIPEIVDPTASIAQNAYIGEGVYVGKQAIVNTSAVIGECAIINSRAVVEHDCTVGAFSHISPGAVLLGGVSVGANTHIGAGSVVRQGIRIGNDTMIGQCSNVLMNVENNVVAYGNPCKVVKR